MSRKLDTSVFEGIVFFKNDNNNQNRVNDYLKFLNKDDEEDIRERKFWHFW